MGDPTAGRRRRRGGLAGLRVLARQVARTPGRLRPRPGFVARDRPPCPGAEAARFRSPPAPLLADGGRSRPRRRAGPGLGPAFRRTGRAGGDPLSDGDRPAYERHPGRWQPYRSGRRNPSVEMALGWVLHSAGPGAPAVTLYQTATGQHMNATLADGSHIDLAGGTHLSVALSSGERHVTLEEGEAIFDVAHDTARPLIIAAGDRKIRVVGTEFDVRRRGDDLSVTVRRGIVEVSPIDPSQGQPVRLMAGDRIDHRIGSAATSASTVSADDVFAWRGGRLVYRDRPLSEVIADLNAQFPRPVSSADAKTADLRFSGVLVLDDEDNVVHRLTLLAPLWSRSGPGGIVVGARDATPN